MSDPLFARFGREFPPGEVLFREGESGDIMFVIQSGAVRITKAVAGADKALAVLGPGEFLGEMAILNNRPRTATATVVETTRCLVIEAKTLESMVSRNAEIALRLIKKLAKRLDSADALVEILMHRDPKARVMLALARHADAFGEPTADGIRIRTTPEEIARDVGVDIAVADEVMDRLRRLRLVTEEPGAVVVADIGRLQDFLEFLEMPQKFGGKPEARVDLRVIGCHGGETPKHRTSAFVIGETLAIDAGALTSGLEIAEQAKLEAVVVSHAHLDHIRDLATLADNRCQLRAPPLVIAATAETIRILRHHFFNGVLWPDFTRIPTADGPTIRFLELEPERPTLVAGRMVRAVLVSHTIEAAAFVIEGPDGAVAYSGDTGPTERMWEVLRETRDLKALLMEVSFPNSEQGLATASGHHSPRTLAADLAKYGKPEDLPTLLYHIKPVFQAEVERECAALKGLNLEVLRLGDHFVL